MLATKGDTQLGGDDLDAIVMDHVTALIEERFGSVTFPPAARQALATVCRVCPHSLSAEDTATIQLDLGEGRVFQESLTREWFEAQASPSGSAGSGVCQGSGSRCRGGPRQN